MKIDRDRLKRLVELELKKLQNEVNPAHSADGTFAKKGKGKTYSLTKNAEDDVADDTELEVPARGRITTQGKISSRYGMNTGDPDKNCGRMTIDGKSKTKTRSCKDYPKNYTDEGQELEEVVPALATAARVATKAGAVADKVGKVANAVSTGAKLAKKVLPDDDEDDKKPKTEKKSTAGRERQKKETEKRNRFKNRNDLVPRAVDSPSVRRDKLFGDQAMMSLARGIAETLQELADDEAEYPRWDRNGKLIQQDATLEEKTLEPHDEIYIRELIKQNVAAALKQTRAQAQKQGVGCRWADLMRAITDIETAQKGHKEPK